MLRIDRPWEPVRGDARFAAAVALSEAAINNGRGPEN
jgi:hypothetical protein